MPIYEYVCESCGGEFEKLVRVGASPPPCPECDGEEVRKLVSAASFVLKGGGWYKDHYGLKSAEGDKGKKAKKGDKADKPAKKTESSGKKSSSSAAA